MGQCLKICKGTFLLKMADSIDFGPNFLDFDVRSILST